ncbi:MAG: AAA family ATPase [Myxococcales bacterium]
METRVRSLQAERKAADALHSLLSDARAYIAATRPGSCPVCGQKAPEDLGRRLDATLEGAASDQVRAVEAALQAALARRTELDQALQNLARASEAFQSRQKALDGVREKAAAALGAAVPEAKVASRLSEAIGQSQNQAESLARQVEALEEKLGALEMKASLVREVLVPVLVKRDELSRQEAQEKEAKARFAAAESRADALETRAAELEAIRKAVLAAKQELADVTLGKAAKKTQELYAALVRHPLFDTLTLGTSAKANKVDYAFTVSAAGKASTSREARHVLSDGQVTAAALGLFFALAESTSHGLDVLYVDDPTQNLDPRTKEAMAKLVTDIAHRRQVIVSTQDPDFVAYLEAEGFFDLAFVHHLSAWDGNPRVGM